jgi:hypothetical protein
VNVTRNDLYRFVAPWIVGIEVLKAIQIHTISLRRWRCLKGDSQSFPVLLI